MTEELKSKLAKIYELVKRGTDGEQAAAKKAMDNLVKKYNLHDIDFETINRKEYGFKYSNRMEVGLMQQIVETFITTENVLDGCYRTYGANREIRMNLLYLDYVTISCAYEYFKRHMKAQWTAICLPKIQRARKASNRAKRRAEIEGLFFEQYIIASRLVNPQHVTKIGVDEMTEKERKARMSINDIEGGQYNRQMNTGLMLEEGNTHGA